MRQALLSVEGVFAASVSYDDARAEITYEADLVETSALVQAIEDVGFGASVIETE